MCNGKAWSEDSAYDCKLDSLEFRPRVLPKDGPRVDLNTWTMIEKVKVRWSWLTLLHLPNRQPGSKWSLS